MPALSHIIVRMNDDVRALGQQFITAAWNTAHATNSHEHGADIAALLSVLDETQAQITGLRLRVIH